MIKTYRYKLKITPSQVILFDRWLNCTRLIYNLSKEVSVHSYSSLGKNLTAYDLQSQVIQLKKEYKWMMELPKDTLIEPVFRYSKAMRLFFNGAGFPKWAKKKTWNSLVFVQQNKILNVRDGFIKLHKGIKLRYFNSTELPDDSVIKSIIVTRCIDGWYASVQFDTKINNITPPIDNQVVGIDMGLVNFVTISNGVVYRIPVFYGNFLKKLRKNQRALSRKKVGGNNWKKQLIVVSKMHQKIARIRQDFQHKISHEIVSKYCGIVVENLSINRMIHGKNLSKKRLFNSRMLDVSISSFISKLEYKSAWNQRSFIKVDPSYSSQECSSCGFISRNNRKNQSLFICCRCNYSDNADINASKVILTRGEGIAIARQREALACA